MTTYVFPGQGAQRIGMGAGLFEQFPRLVALADDVLGYSIRTLCLEDPHRQLSSTAFTQPAVYTVNCLDYLRVLRDRSRRPDYVAGHSLGEYAALFAAGVFDFETGLRLVQRRGALMAQVVGGAMAAVIGLGVAQVARILAESTLADLVVANDNSDHQVVVAGPREAISGAQTLFERAGAQRYLPLPVSGAFHSPLMAGVQQEFARYLDTIPLEDPLIPVIGNVDARPFAPGSMRERLGQQITAPVRWRGSIGYLLDQGETEFEERGEGQILTRLIQQIRAGREASSSKGLAAALAR